jgi:ABC-type lipoprotein export system ATPase subunit
MVLYQWKYSHHKNEEDMKTQIPYTTDQEPIIRVSGVTRDYKMSKRNTAQALRGIDLTINRGEIVAVTGPSGSGKSTLVHLLAGLDQPTEGKVWVDGHDVQQLHGGALAAYRGSTIGIVFQFFYLQPFLSVRRNIEIPLMFARTARKTRPAIIEEAIEAVGLETRADYLPKELSGGQMQRVAIARAIINRPRVLLADEPTGNLDAENSQRVLEVLQQIRQRYQTTIVIITHDAEVARWADRTIKILDGRVQA